MCGVEDTLVKRSIYTAKFAVLIKKSVFLWTLTKIYEYTEQSGLQNIWTCAREVKLKLGGLMTCTCARSVGIFGVWSWKKIGRLIPIIPIPKLRALLVTDCR